MNLHLCDVVPPGAPRRRHWVPAGLLCEQAVSETAHKYPPRPLDPEHSVVPEVRAMVALSVSATPPPPRTQRPLCCPEPVGPQ